MDSSHTKDVAILSFQIVHERRKRRKLSPVEDFSGRKLRNIMRPDRCTKLGRRQTVILTSDRFEMLLVLLLCTILADPTVGGHHYRWQFTVARAKYFERTSHSVI